LAARGEACWWTTLLRRFFGAAVAPIFTFEKRCAARLVSVVSAKANVGQQGSVVGPLHLGAVGRLSGPICRRAKGCFQKAVRRQQAHHFEASPARTTGAKFIKTLIQYRAAFCRPLKRELPNPHHSSHRNGL